MKNLLRVDNIINKILQWQHSPQTNSFARREKSKLTNLQLLPFNKENPSLF